MKKNFTINLNGSLYNIDEDAYEMLRQYTESVRRYFQRQEGGEEIANDIECRIGELLDELTATGKNAIDIEDVQAIIQRVGNVDDLSDTASGSGPTAPEYNAGADPHRYEDEGLGTALSNWLNRLSKRTYYRDGQHAMVAGVLSGCANYFGGGIFAWRLIYSILLILSVIFGNGGFFALIGIYILVAILAPEAKTPDTRLKMKGLDVTPQSIADEVAESAEEYTYSTREVEKPKRSKSLGVFSVIFSVIMMMIGILAVIVFIVDFCLIAALVGAPYSLIYEVFGYQPQTEAIYANIGVVWGILGSVLAASAIVSYLLIHFALSTFNKVHPMTKAATITLSVLLLLSIGVLVASVVKINCLVYETYRAGHDYRINECIETVDDEINLVELADTVTTIVNDTIPTDN